LGRPDISDLGISLAGVNVTEAKIEDIGSAPSEELVLSPIARDACAPTF
jgi:hypothetical protein